MTPERKELVYHVKDLLFHLKDEEAIQRFLSNR